MNLRKVATVSAGVAVVSAIAVVTHWRELSTGREQTPASQTRADSSGQSETELPGVDAGIATPAQNSDTLPPTTPQTDRATAQVPGSGQELLKDLEYQKAQAQVSAYATAFEKAGVPLDGFQIETITKAMFNEQKSLKQDIVALARSVDLAIPESRTQAEYALKRRRGESNQRVFDAVFPWLAPPQQRIFRDQIESHGPSRTAGAPARETAMQ